MGKILKRFAARKGRADSTGDALIDSGADRTVLRLDVACRLGLDPATVRGSAMSTATGQRLIGYSLPVRVTVGERAARVSAFVPIGVLTTTGGFKGVHQHNLIGSDFLQGAEVKLDYGRPHRSVFSGVGRLSGFDKFVRPTVAERRALRAFRACATSSRGGNGR